MPADPDLIGEDEEPLTMRALDLALAPYLTRSDRRRFFRALASARLIVFPEQAPDE
jgi:hypothetical protein